MRKSRYLRLLAIVIGTGLFLLTAASANAASANVSRSYKAATGIPNGSIVSLDPQQTGYVQLSSTGNGARLIGVALASQDSLLAIDPTSNTIQVAISGSVNTFITTANGDIKVGDQISVSPFDGVGMEAGPGTRIVGVAQTAFNSATAGATTEQIKDKSGQSHKIIVGYVRLSISIGATTSASGSGDQANFLQKFVKSLTGHTISTARIILSVVVTLVALISLITIIYASVYGSIVSIGRNPLARRAVFRTLSSVMVMAVITVAIAGVTIYFLLS